jgi:hypothetical protein
MSAPPAHPPRPGKSNGKLTRENHDFGLKHNRTSHSIPCSSNQRESGANRHVCCFLFPRIAHIASTAMYAPPAAIETIFEVASSTGASSKVRYGFSSVSQSSQPSCA